MLQGAASIRIHPARQGGGQGKLAVYRLENECADDLWEVEALFDSCFAPGREALSSYRLRDGIAPLQGLCFVARDEAGILGGAIRYWPVRVGKTPALLLGPVAVHPTRQGEGLGRQLIETSLASAHGAWDRVILVGDAPYYSRLGFERLPDVMMPPPTNPARVLGRALKPQAWDSVQGRVVQWSGAHPS